MGASSLKLGIPKPAIPEAEVSVIPEAEVSVIPEAGVSVIPAVTESRAFCAALSPRSAMPVLFAVTPAILAREGTSTPRASSPLETPKLTMPGIPSASDKIPTGSVSEFKAADKKPSTSGLPGATVFPCWSVAKPAGSTKPVSGSAIPVKPKLSSVSPGPARPESPQPINPGAIVAASAVAAASAAAASAVASCSSWAS